jgi:hypothetical protein
LAEEQRTQSDRTNRALLAALLLAPVLVAIILYWPTLQLPLIYDDLLHIRIAKGLDLASVWLPTDEFGFYRPLTFLPLLLIKNIFGFYPSELLHGLNVFQHAVNGALLVALSWRLWRKTHWALAAGLLFVLFPFSYQAVSVYGHNVHPTTTGILLAGLHTYLSAIRAQKRAYLWWIATVLLFFFGLLSHESAILFGVFAALLHWNDRGQLPRFEKRDLGSIVREVTGWPWVLFLIAGLLYAVGYQFLDLSRAPQAAYGDNSLWYKFLYLGQGGAYPVTWFGRWLGGTEPAAAALVIAGLGLMLALTFWSGRDRTNRLPLLFGWGWWGMASLLVALPLETGYFLHGPRLLCLSSVGLALLWPVMLEPIYKIAKGGRLVWGAILLVILASNWLYIRERLSDYTQLTSPVDLVEEQMAGRPEGEGVILINLPQWIDRSDNTYQVGVDLVAMLGDYLFAEELIGENIQLDRPTKAFLAQDLLRAYPEYNYGLHDQSEGDSLIGDWAPEGSHVFITTYSEEGIQARYAGSIAPSDGTAVPMAAIGPLGLLEADAQRCDGVVITSTTWRILPGKDQELRVLPTTSIFVQYIDNDGQLIDQQDGPLLTLGPDLLKLEQGWLVIDKRELQAVEGQQGQLLIGVYDYANGERYRALDHQGDPLQDDAFRVPIDDCSQ